MAPLLSPRFRDDPVLQAVSRGMVRLGRPTDRGAPPIRSSGPAVVAVQRALLDLGYTLPRWGPDGRYGQETYAAVLSYKRDRNILTDQGFLDGIVGPRTMASLDAAFPPPAPPAPRPPLPVVAGGPVPIVFVAGLMGSRICPKDTSGSPGAVWDPDDKAGMLLLMAKAFRDRNIWELLGIDRRPLADFPSTFFGSGPSPGDGLSSSRIAQIKAQRRWERVSFNFYGEFLLAAERRFNTPPFPVSCPVFAFGYDWRQSNADSARRLIEYVRTHVFQVVPGARSAVLVTHSMGGLVARAALRDPSFASQICGVVHAMQPSTGALVAYRRCVTGVRLIDDEVSLNSAMAAVGASRATAAVLALILGTTPLAFTTNILAMPGALELLPNRDYQRPWMFTQRPAPLTPTDTTPTDPYALYVLGQPLALLRQDVVKFYSQRRPAITRGNLTGRIVAAARFHDSIRTTFHPNTFVVFGNGKPTDTATLVIGGMPPVRAIKSPEGDGTVPAHSGCCPTAGRVTRIPMTNVEHSECFNNPGFRQVVLQQIDRILAAPCGPPAGTLAEAMQGSWELLPSY